MNLNYIYENMRKIPDDCMDNFKRKCNLSILEKLGLEVVIVEFFVQYERENFGEVSIDREQNIRDFIRWNSNYLDILDGVYDTYEFDGYLFSEIWTTENGCIMISAFEIPEEHLDDWQNCDFVSEFKEIYIRLD